MRKIGIISVPEDKKSLLKRIRSSAETVGEFGDCQRYIAAEISHTADMLGRMSRKKLIYIIKTADLTLRRCGADISLLSGVMRDIAEKKGVEWNFCTDKLAIPINRVSECFSFMAKKLDLYNNIGSRAAVVDCDLRFADRHSLAMICRGFDRVTLYTDKIETAENLADIMLCEYGALLSIRTYSELHSSDIGSCVNADMGKIRINDFTIDGAEFESQSGKYLLNPNDEARALENDNNLPIKNWLSGKNKINL